MPTAKRASVETDSTLWRWLAERPGRMARDVWAGLLDLVYPPHCLVCGAADDGYLCAACIEKIDFIEPPFCPVCGLPGDPGRCFDCGDRQFEFEFARSVGTFDGVLRKAIHALKYGSHIAMAGPLADLMARSFADTRLAGRFDFVTAIPIHRSRVLERGFNQADELARRLCDRLGLVYAPGVLVKPWPGKRQVELPHDLRTANMRGAFAAPRPAAVTGKRVLLVDDVFTTGSTLDEAAKTLLAAGCAEVYAYTVARSV